MKWRGAAPAQVSWSESAEPLSVAFSDVYFRTDTGLQESRHVFIEGSQLPQRWQAWDKPVFTIVETGFGTGLNFLSTWQAWQAHAHKDQRLHYLSIEGFPLQRQDLTRALAGWTELTPLAAELLDNYPPPLPGRHRLLLAQGRICLDLLINELEVALDQLTSTADLQVDAWFLDGFAPARNPAMWTAPLYRAMSCLGYPGTSFATFTAAGDVRRGLESAGFEVEKISGYGLKRETLRGRLLQPADPAALDATPWQLPLQRYPGAGTGKLRAVDRSLPGQALVIGAGLAGAGTAAALANRGWQVTVLDQQQTAGAASGDPQGTLYTRLSHRPSDLNDFSLHSYSYASRFYRHLFESGQLQAGRDGELCGSLHLHREWSSEHPLFESVASLPDLVRAVDSTEASRLSGLQDCSGGLYFPGSGWMSPVAVCRALLTTPGITLRQDCGPIKLSRDAASWLALDQAGAELCRAPVAIIAGGTGSKLFPESSWIKLQSIRGQTSQLASRGPLRKLKTVICHDGYLPPAHNGEHCIGATFAVNDPATELRQQDHDHNMALLLGALPMLANSADVAGLRPQQGRVGFRCASPDYLPIVGPLPDLEAFCDNYAELRRNARRVIPRAGSYYPGLYLNTGHGSRGLTSTPLAAELLASQICAEPAPTDPGLCRALSPARFIVRDLVRNRR